MTACGGHARKMRSMTKSVSFVQVDKQKAMFYRLAELGGQQMNGLKVSA